MPALLRGPRSTACFRPLSARNIRASRTCAAVRRRVRPFLIGSAPAPPT